MNVLNLLSLEWKKWKKNSVVFLFTLMYFITAISVIWIGKEFDNVPEALMNPSSMFNFPEVWEWQAYIASWLIFFFLGYMVIYIVTAEVGFKTLRQNIITGLSRNEYFLSKLYVIIVLSVIATLFNVVFCALVGYFHADPNSFAGVFENTNKATLRFFLMSMGYLSFALMIGFLIRKPGLAIFTYFTYTLFLEPLGKLILQGNFELGSIVNYLPLNTFEDLSRFPPYKIAKNIPAKVLPEDFFLSHDTAIMLSAVYIILFVSISYWSFKRSDI